MQKKNQLNDARGFSLMELVLAITIMLIVLGLAFSLFGRSLTTRQRESSRTDALTSAQAALNVLSREIANSGYGLMTNGIVSGDSNDRQLHVQSNVINSNTTVTDPGEDITYFYEPVSQSILRHDANKGGPGVGETSVIINRISNVEFRYFDYIGNNPVGTQVLPPTGSKTNTGRVRVLITVSLEPVAGQPNPQNVQLVSDVTLRNSEYMLMQY